MAGLSRPENLSPFFWPETFDPLLQREHSSSKRFSNDHKAHSRALTLFEGDLHLVQGLIMRRTS